MFCWGPHYASEVKLCIMYVRSVSFQKKKKKKCSIRNCHWKRSLKLETFSVSELTTHILKEWLEKWHFSGCKINCEPPG